MPDEDLRDDRDEDAPRPRPRVVDKRVSATRDAQGPGRAAAASRASAVTSDPPPPSSPDGGDVTADPGGPAGAAPLWTPEQEAEARRITQEIADTPSVEWVVNVALTLANVAAAKIDRGSAQDAGTAIDALAALVGGVGTRLGAAETPLRRTLAELQLAYADAVAGG